MIAHEIGHYSLHRKANKFFNCDEKSFFEYHTKGGQEVEANEFASELLMPTKTFKEKAKKSEFAIPIIQDLSEYFETSITSTSIKYAEYGPIPLAMVFSQDAKVKWTKVSNKFPLKFINTKVTVPKNSAAAYYFNNYSLPDKPIQLNANEWFYNDFKVGRFYKAKIFEQCWPIKSMNAVISYIWLK